MSIIHEACFVIPSVAPRTSSLWKSAGPTTNGGLPIDTLILFIIRLPNKGNVVTSENVKTQLLGSAWFLWRYRPLLGSRKDQVCSLIIPTKVTDQQPPVRCYYCNELVNERR